MIKKKKTQTNTHTHTHTHTNESAIENVRRTHFRLLCNFA